MKLKGFGIVISIVLVFSSGRSAAAANESIQWNDLRNYIVHGKIDELKHGIEKFFEGRIPPEDELLLWAPGRPRGLKAVEILLAHGADIGVADSSGMNLLLVACQNADYEMVSFALNHGFNVNFKNDWGQSALAFAAASASDDEDSRRIPRLLLDHGAFVNVQRFDGRSPLMNAVMAGDVSVVELLLQYGASPLLRDAQSQVARDYLEPELSPYLEADKREAMKLLLENASRPSHK